MLFKRCLLSLKTETVATQMAEVGVLTEVSVHFVCLLVSLKDLFRIAHSNLAK